MNETELRHVLEEVRSGARTPDEALASLRRLPFVDLGFARVDHHRAVRQPWAEAVYAPGKTDEQCAAVVSELLAASDSPVVLTRASEEQIRTVVSRNPFGQQLGSTVVWRPAGARPECVVVATGGTSDLPVANECVATLRAYGLNPTQLTDVGVAGVHRLLASIDHVLDADVVVVIAGMDGALASVVGGLTGAPVIAVPTSVGYGAALEGITPLLSMLASCAAGLTVVGIDNGFGAACAVQRLLK